jgi:multidrug efflux pump
MTPVSVGPARTRFNISRWALEHPALTRYLMVVMLLLGAAAYFQLGQDEDPPFTFRAMAVQAFWSGASAQEVAEQVTDRIEKSLQQVPYAARLRSYTKAGESLTILELADSTPPKEVANSWYQARKLVQDARSALPPGVVGPVFNDNFGDVYGSIFTLSADGFSRDELRVFAERVRKHLLQVPDVAKVETFGVQAEKVFVEISQKRLAQLGLDMNQVVAQIAAQNAVESGGALNTGAENLQVRVGGVFQSVDDLARLPIRGGNASAGAGGVGALKLGDLATIERGYVDPPTVKVRHQGREVIALGVSMAKGGDILALGKRLGLAAARARAELPLGIDLVQVQDQPQAVSRSVNEFVGVLIEAVLIVLLVSFVSLGLHFGPLRIDLRPGLVVGITIPLVLSITFVVMYYWGIGLHKISLGSLIIALGLLVDDAIIAVEMMVRKLEEGYSKARAATFAYEVTAMPMLTGTLITAAGFLPIGLAKSMTGEYTFAIFAVTAAALLISWFVSVYFVPYLGSVLLRSNAAVDAAPGAPTASARAGLELNAQRSLPGAANDVQHSTQHSDQQGALQNSSSPHELFDGRFYVAFRATVNWCVQHRWLTIAMTVACFALGVVGMGRVEQQFFPDSSRPEVLIDLWLPEGATIQHSEAVAKRFEQRMMKEPGLTSVTSWVGSGVPRFYLPLDQIFPGQRQPDHLVAQGFA